MRTVFTLGLVLFAISLSSAQSANIPEWMQLKFGEESADFDAQKLAFYVFVDAEGVSVADVAPKDISGLPDALSVLPLFDGVPALTSESLIEEDFNPELYAFDRANNEPVYYRVGETSYIVKVESMTDLKSKFQQQQ